MKKMKLLSLLTFCLNFAVQINAQYAYSVSTIIPPNSHTVDDGLCLDDSGNLYGSYWGIWQGTPGRHILRYRTDGTYDTLATGLNRPNGIAYRAGKIYVANNATSQIFEIDTASGLSQIIATVAGASAVTVVPNHPDSLLVSSWGGNRIYGVGPSGTSIISSSSLLNGPVGMTYDPAGNLYVGNFNNGRVLKYDGNGVFSIFATVAGAVSFVTYSDSTLIVTDHQSKRIHFVPLDGGGIVTIGSGVAATVDGINNQASFHGPNGVVATPSGDTIYVSEFGSKALRMILRFPTSLSTPRVNKEANPIQVYYNQTTKSIQFEQVDLEEDLAVRVFDLGGRLLLEQTLTQDSLRVDLQQGAYLIHLTKGKKVLHQKKLVVGF